MPNETLLKFPVDLDGAPIQVRKAEGTLDLFGGNDKGSGRIVFVDVDALSEEILLRIIARNAIASVVDLRPRPVFMRPRFRHKRVVSYLYRRNVLYIEYAFLLLSMSKSPYTAKKKSGSADEEIENALKRGLTMFLYDEEAKVAGLMDDVRRRLKRLSSFSAELHPRALATNRS